jgi:hypothetical protein
MFNCCGCEKSARDYSQLHFVEQWLMVSLYNRQMIYFTNGNKKLKNAEKLYHIVKDLPVMFVYVILSEMSGVTKKLSFTERYFWSSQVPVFNYITKKCDEFFKTSDKEGFMKKMYTSFKKNLDHMMNMDPKLRNVIGNAVIIAASFFCHMIIKQSPTNYFFALGLSTYSILLVDYLNFIRKHFPNNKKNNVRT